MVIVKFISLLYILTLILFFIFFSWIIVRSFWKLNSPKLVTSVPLWAEKHIFSLAKQFRSMAEKWIAGAWQWLSFRSRPRSSSQFASAAALWLDFSRYHCPCFCWTLNLDKINIPFQSRAVWSTLLSACAGFTVVCNGRFFIWHIPSQNRALMPRWQWGMPVNFQPDQTYFSKPG